MDFYVKPLKIPILLIKQTFLTHAASLISLAMVLKIFYYQCLLGKFQGELIKLSTSAGSWEKQESSRKISISALLTMPKPLTVWITVNSGKF